MHLHDPGAASIVGKRARQERLCFFVIFALTYTVHAGGRPPNDDFASRTALVGANLVLATEIGGATAEPNEPLLSAATNSIWWTWTSPADGDLRLNVKASSKHIDLLSVYRGNSLQGLLPLAWTSEEEILLKTQKGDQLQISAATFDSSSGTAVLALRLFEPPGNDQFASRQLVSGSHFGLQGTTRGGTVEPFETVSYLATPERSLWWEWDCPETGYLRLVKEDTGGAWIDLWHSSPPEPVQLGQLGYSVNSGESYYIRASSASAADFAFRGAFVAATALPTANQPIVRDNRFVTLSFDVGPNQPSEIDVFWGGRSDGAPDLILTNSPWSTELEFDPGYYSAFYGIHYRGGGLLGGALRAFSISPPNDNFENAIEIPPTGGSGSFIGVRGSSFEVGEPEHYGQRALSMWWRWKPASDGRARLKFEIPPCCGNEPGFAVYSGDALTNLVFLGKILANQYFRVRGGTEYHIAAYAGMYERFTLEVLPPISDDFADRKPFQLDAFNYGDLKGAASAWWTLNVASAGFLVLQTDAFRTELPYASPLMTGATVYMGSDLQSLRQIPQVLPDNPPRPDFFPQVLPNVPNASPEGEGLEYFYIPSAGELDIQVEQGYNPDSYGILPVFKAAPANDQFTNAITIKSLPFFDAVQMNRTWVRTSGCFGRCVWYRWKCEQDQLVAVHTVDSDAGTYVHVYEGDTLDPLQCPSDQPVVYSGPFFQAHAGKTYTFTLEAQIDGSQMLYLTGGEANTTFATALPLPSSSFPASFFTGDISSTEGATLWWKWSPTYDGSISFRTPPDFELFAGDPALGALPILHLDYDNFGRPRREFRVQAGGHYWLRVKTSAWLPNFTSELIEYTFSTLRVTTPGTQFTVGDPIPIIVEIGRREDAGSSISLDVFDLERQLFAWNNLSLHEGGTNIIYDVAAGLYEASAVARSATYFYTPPRFTFSVGDSNDAFSRRRPVNFSRAANVGSLAGSTVEPEVASRLPSGTKGTLWWEWNATQTAPAHFISSVPLAIFEGEAIASLSLRSPGATNFVFNAQAGHTYQIAALRMATNGGQVSFQLPAPNDLFENATPLEFAETNAFVIPAWFFGGTVEPGEPRDSNDGGDSVWWKWTAPAKGLIQFEDSDPNLTVWTGEFVGQLNQAPILPAEINVLPVVLVEGGVTYRFRRTTPSDGRPSDIKCRYWRTPPNGSFASAIAITNPVQEIVGNNWNFRAVPEDAPYPAGGWWKLIAPADGLVHVQGTGPSVDFYAGESIGALKGISVFTAAGNSNFDASVSRGLSTFPVAGGQTYYLQLGARSLLGSGPFDILVNFAAYSPNDMFANSATIATNHFHAAGSDAGSTFEGPEVFYGNQPGGSLWWNWKAPAEGLLKVRSFGFLSLFHGSAIANLQPVMELHHNGAALHVQAGELLQIKAVRTLPGNFDWSLDFTPGKPNDSLLDARELGGASSSFPANFDFASGPLDVDGNATRDRELWWRWTAPVPGTLGVYHLGNMLPQSYFLYESNDQRTRFSVDPPTVTGGRTYYLRIPGQAEDGFLLRIEPTSPVQAEISVSRGAVSIKTSASAQSIFRMDRSTDLQTWVPRGWFDGPAAVFKPSDQEQTEPAVFFRLAPIR